MKKVIAALLITFMCSFAYAEDIDFTSAFTQEDFKKFNEQLGQVLYFNPNSPAEPLGITGFDIAAETTVTQINADSDYWERASGNKTQAAYIPITKVHIQKGLPFNIDVGAMIGQVPTTNIKIYGGEIKYAILEGTAATPALAVRATHSWLSGVADLDASTSSIELMASKGFLFLTPYAGVAALYSKSSENSSAVNLKDESATTFRGIAGLQMSPFPFFVVNAEVGVGKANSASLKLGLRF